MPCRRVEPVARLPALSAPRRVPARLGAPRSRAGSTRRSVHSAPLDARLLIVGLAPGLQGANRTGRPFTGDYAGVLLYETLERVRLRARRISGAAGRWADAGRRAHQQRGALRPAREQADPAGNQHMPGFSGGDDRRHAAPRDHGGARPHRSRQRGARARRRPADPIRAWRIAQDRRTCECSIAIIARATTRTPEC